MQAARRALIRAAYLSPAKYVIVPLQDLLGTGGVTRMNVPGTLGTQNWSRRYRKVFLSDDLAREIRAVCCASER